jgi:hypothetical protein
MATPIVTTELMEKCLNVCRSEVARAFGPDAQGAERKSLHMDATAIIGLLVWKIVAPFFVSVTAGVTAAALNAQRIKEQNVRGLKEMIQERMGQKIRIDPTRIEECVLLIEEVLQPFDVDRDKARRIVDVLVATASEPKGSNP